MGSNCSKVCFCTRGSNNRQLNFTELESCSGHGHGREPISHSNSIKYSWDLKKSQACIIDGLESGEVIEPTLGQQVIIKNCKRSRIYILDWTTSATIDDCSDCVIIVSAVGGSLFLRDTTSSTLVSAASQLRVRDCSDIHLFSACESDPIIESCNNIKVAPYFLFYDKIQEHFKSAKLDNFLATKWRNLYDYTPSETPNWSVMKEPVDPNKYIPKLDKGTLSNPIRMEAFKGFHLGSNSYVPITQDQNLWKEKNCLVVVFPEMGTSRGEALDFVQNCTASHPQSLLLTTVKEGEAADGRQKVLALLLSITPQELPTKYLGSVRYTQDRRSIEYFFHKT